MDDHRTRTNRFLAMLAIALALAYASYFQRALMDSFRQSPGGGRLEKDALEYYELAVQDRPFYAASMREPLFPTALRVVIRLFGHRQPADDEQLLHNHILARRFTAWTGLGLIVGIAALGWKLSGPWCGAIAAWMYATSTAAIFYSVSGLREIPVSLLLVVLTLLLLWTPDSNRARWARRIMLAVLCAALPLMRLDALTVVPMILAAWAVIAWRDALRRVRKLGTATIPPARDGPPIQSTSEIVMTVVVCTVLACVSAAPFLSACKKEYGSYFAVTNYHMTPFRNFEFAGRPGFPTREEVMASAQSGTQVSAGQYIFGEHSMGEVVARYLKGYWLCLTRYTPRVFSALLPTPNGVTRFANPLIWFWILGLGWAVRQWRTQGLIPLAGLVAQFPFAFILPLNTILPGRDNAGVELRFSLPIAPFIAVLAGIGTIEMVYWFNRRLNREPASPRPPRAP